MSHRYSTALSHIILAGTGIYCLMKVGTHHLDFPQFTFGIITVNSILGVWRYGNPEYGDGVDGPYRLTTFLQTIFALPCITTTVWLANAYQRELAWAHTLVSILPLISYLGDRSSNELVDLIIGINIISLAVVSFIAENYFGIAAAVSFAFNHYCIRNEGTFADIPAQDMYNYGLCFFAYFAMRSIGAGTPLQV